MSVANRIRSKLDEAFKPLELEVKDVSDKHIGHAGHDGRGESHFRIKMVAEVFDGKGRLERQRMVYDLLKEEMNTRIHALELRLSGLKDITR